MIRHFVEACASKVWNEPGFSIGAKLLGKTLAVYEKAAGLESTL